MLKITDTYIPMNKH